MSRHPEASQVTALPASDITTIAPDFSGARVLAEVCRERGKAPFVICEKRSGRVIACIPHPTDIQPAQVLIEESRRRRVSLLTLAI